MACELYLNKSVFKNKKSEEKKKERATLDFGYGSSVPLVRTALGLQGHKNMGSEAFRARKVWSPTGPGTGSWIS